MSLRDDFPRQIDLRGNKGKDEILSYHHKTMCTVEGDSDVMRSVHDKSIV